MKPHNGFLTDKRHSERELSEADSNDTNKD
jgi:hypothetical protein